MDGQTKHETMISLPMELVEEILSRLPVKPLLRFRCVCRDWRNLIDSTSFVKSHLLISQSTQNGMDRCIITTGWPYSHLHSIGLKSLSETFELDLLSWWPDPEEKGYFRFLWGSCNGLLCLSSCAEDVCLWNPSINKHFVLPPFQVNDFEQTTDHYPMLRGFGFDSSTDDYKVVRLHDKNRKKDHFGIHIYSLRSNSWRILYGFPKGLYDEFTAGFLFEESLHWLFSDHEFVCPTRYYNLIVAFDLGTEETYVIPLPSSEKCLTLETSFTSLLVIEECLALGVLKRDVGLDLWIMEEYGAASSWTKLISICGLDIDSYYCLWPVSYSKNEGVILIGYSYDDLPQLISWRDFETIEIQEIPLIAPQSIHARHLFLLETLVTPNSGAHL